MKWTGIAFWPLPLFPLLFAVFAVSAHSCQQSPAETPGGDTASPYALLDTTGPTASLHPGETMKGYDFSVVIKEDAPEDIRADGSMSLAVGYFTCTDDFTVRHDAILLAANQEEVLRLAEDGTLTYRGQVIGHEPAVSRNLQRIVTGNFTCEPEKASAE